MPKKSRKPTKANTLSDANSKAILNPPDDSPIKKELEEVKQVYLQKTASDLLSEKSRLEVEARLAEMTHKFILPFLEDLTSGADPDASPDLRFKASQDIMNRYVGKPKETVDLQSSVIIKIDV